MKPVPLLACLLALTLSACNPPTQYPDVAKGVPTEPPAQRARLAYLSRTAALPVTCTLGADCAEKWTRVRGWVAQHSVYSIKTDTANLIETYGPIGPTTDSAFTVAMKQQDTATGSITFTSSCGKTPVCSPTALELRSSFNNFVLYGN